MSRLFRCLPCTLIVLFSSSLRGTEAIDFGRQIRPILSAKCFSCHGPDEEHRKADLRLDIREGAFAVEDGVAVLAPGKPQESEAWLRIHSDDKDDVMPPPKAKNPLSTAEKELIRQWIEQGAPWAEHWSLAPPSKNAVPEVDSSQSHNEIDAFIFDRLQDTGLAPSPEADRATLLRRLSFDLTGLPPTLEEVEKFIDNSSENAYEIQVDRLLSSPHFGERMALMWLDAARYGDTSVMHADGPRDMWPWRDWVVDAYNQNQPYDQFSIEQLAGDLLPDPTLSQKIATGFNRNHPSSDEGGAIAEELRVSYVVDRVKTTSNVWLGLSMECAQCHDHKYDPISQKEYFQFYAYFNNTVDPGMQTRKGNQAPLVNVVSKHEEADLREIDQLIESGTKTSEAEKKLALNSVSGWLEKQKGTTEALADSETRLKNLKHYFPLDEPSGSLISDVLGNKDASGDKAIKTAAGERGNAIEFDGSTAYSVPDFTEYDNRSKLTLSAWVKIDSNFTGAILSKMDKSMNYRGYDLWIEKGRPGIHLVNSWPKNAVKVITDEPIEMGTWQHIAVTYDGSGKAENIKIYINGESRDHTVQNGAKLLKSTIKNDIPFRIGGRKGDSFFRGQLDDLRIYDRALSPKEITWTMDDPFAAGIKTDPKKWGNEQTRLISGIYLARHADTYRKAKSELVQSHLERLKIITGKTTTMVMADNPDHKMRKTYILDRGAYDAPKKDEEIRPGIPAVLPALPDDSPANRLTLAKWLFTPEHPLTSRVAVNQLWQLLFGTGIVSTPGDFGAQGDFPSHPELLDWLAVDFRESGWDIKRMIKKILMSHTYRQQSNVGPQHLETDAANRLLARAPRFRLTAEMIRDNALALSGLLVDEIGGPGVKPYQPPGLWAEVSLGGNPKFVQDHDDKLFRRSLYTYWKRSAPHPAMVIFDAPNRETCVLKRPNTNTPLQALAALNDIQMIEASRHFAERLLTEGGGNIESRANYAFRTATARKATSQEISTIVAIYQKSLETYSADKAKTEELLSAGESKRDLSLNQSEHAAWTLVCSMLLNLDEVLNRN